MHRGSVVALGYGTRPQVIKAARLLPALGERYTTFAIDTGQHYDYELNALLYEQLAVPPPDVLLGVGSASRDEQLARIEVACRDALRHADPRVVVVIGDTNSTLGCARAAASLGIPVVHVEAGLRSHVPQMAEEMNRVEVDQLAALLCAPSQAAMRSLHTEGLGARAALTGDVARDVMAFALQRGVPDAPSQWPIEPDRPYLFATLHRAELTDDPRLLGGVIDALATMTMPVVLALHPRTRERLPAMKDLARHGALHFTKPLGYLDTLAAIQRASGVVTDSGGVQREAYWLGVPCLTLRRETEWTETIALGANRLVDPRRAASDLASVIDRMLSSPTRWDRNEYGTGEAAAAIVAAVAGIGALVDVAMKDA
jgi:UDP-N-acetylglucosamine 2-epimerase